LSSVGLETHTTAGLETGATVSCTAGRQRWWGTHMNFARGSSECTFLNRKIVNSLHELFRGDGVRRKIGRPVLGACGENHFIALLANEDLRSGELKLLRKSNCLTPVIHENPGSSLHRTLPHIWHIHKYMSLLQNYQETGTKDSSAPTGLWIVLAAFPRIPPSLRSGSILGYSQWPLRGQITHLR